MKCLDWTLPTPEQNLAADEALLDWCEAREASEVLRFWSSAQPFVVVGYANDVATEVNLAACAARGVPVLRRCTGGGTVLQGPGCLNYALVLRITRDGPTRNISATNQFVMEHNCAALQSAIGDVQGSAASLHSAGRSPSPRPSPPGRGRQQTPRCEEMPNGVPFSALPKELPLPGGEGWGEGEHEFRLARHGLVSVRGHTDLALDGVKFSGNAQRRKRRCLLFHGTILLNLDLALVEELLPMPSRQPEYRQNRPHRDFIRNLPLSADTVKHALASAWSAEQADVPGLDEAIETLIGAKYGRRDWNLKLAETENEAAASTSP